ncbi:MAG: DinB/UmuC family translesion DNA polymerase [Longimicrobiales bacterium]
MIVCLRRRDEAPAGWAEGAAEVLLSVAPRVAVDADSSVWLDARGLDAAVVARHACERLEIPIGCGVSSVPVVAWVAAGSSEEVRVIEQGEEATFIGALPLDVLEPDERLRTLLVGVGVETCGELAALAREAVEVRFGAEAVGLWRRARAEDDRMLFGAPVPERARASLDFVDYVVSDPERLAFTVNALLGRLCDELVARGLHARALMLTLTLANGSEWRRTLRAARPTASRSAWLRLVRSLLEKLTVPDSIAGIALEVGATEPARAVQGDLFDAGFATAAAVEAAVARLLESVGGVVYEPDANAHPLAEKRTILEPVPLAMVAERRVKEGDRGRSRSTSHAAHERVAGSSPGGTARSADRIATDAFDGRPDQLTLQLLPKPKPIEVETERRRDHDAPVRCHDGAWRRIVDVAGPDRLSGGQWDRSYAREYFRVVTEDGLLLWIFRDAVQGRWYLHGWWD